MTASYRRTSELNSVFQHIQRTFVNLILRRTVDTPPSPLLNVHSYSKPKPGRHDVGRECDVDPHASSTANHIMIVIHAASSYSTSSSTNMPRFDAIRYCSTVLVWSVHSISRGCQYLALSTALIPMSLSANRSNLR